MVQRCQCDRAGEIGCGWSPDPIRGDAAQFVQIRGVQSWPTRAELVVECPYIHRTHDVPFVAVGAGPTVPRPTRTRTGVERMIQPEDVPHLVGDERRTPIAALETEYHLGAPTEGSGIRGNVEDHDESEER